jgi:hypothetical protein
MSKADEYRRYADEALRWAAGAKTEKEKQALLDLARTWNDAALQSEKLAAGNGSVSPSAR